MQRAQKGVLCAAALAEVASLWVSPGSLFFLRFFSMRVLRFIILGDCWGQKTWISATLHRQGPRTVSEARNACFGITGARNRPIPTLVPIETCTQTPLDRPRMLFRRDPDFADAPETAQNGGFHHNFATARFLADSRPSARRPRHKASFARYYWLRNVAGAKYSFAPQGHFFFVLKRAHMGTTAYVLAR